MAKIFVKRDTVTNEKMLLGIDKFMNFCLFLYLCATSAHQSGEGFDAFFIRATFVLYLGSVALSFFVEKKRLMLNNYILWLFAFFGFCYLSFLWARRETYVMQYSNTFIQIFAVAIGLSQQLKSNEDINKLFKIIHLSMIYLGFYILLVTPIDEFGTERIGHATGLHANDIGFRLATGVLLSIYFYTNVKQFKWFYMLSAIGLSVLVLLTGSRKSIGMILICVFAYVVFYKNRKTTKENLKVNMTKKLALFTTIVVALIVLWYVMMNVEFFYNVMGFRFESMLNTFIGKESDTSMNERAFFTEKAIELFKQHPIIGYGCNNFIQYMREIGNSHVAYSHNNLLELLSTLGIIGTTIYYVPLLAFTYNLLKCYLNDTKNQLGLILLIFMTFTFAMTSYSMYYISEMYYPFFISTFMYGKFNKVKKEIKK